MPPAVTSTVASEDRIHRRTSSKKFFCKICLADCPAKKGAALTSCSCVFCKQCLKEYLTHAIRDGNVLHIPCPDGQCTKDGEITESEICDLMTDDQFHNFLRLRTIKAIQIDKSRAFCPKPGCEGVCEGMPDTAQQVFCSECDHSFCFGCKEPWHSNLSCIENKKTGTDTATGKKFLDIVKSEDGEEIKECPICQVLIQRDEGCAQMMCGNCKHIFCWHCRKSLDNDIMLRHYDKGPCRNKLGHSRTTLFLHRTQVVAGFVFFGAMIIVASPFLLLISPCFVLSKCLFREKKPKS